MKEKTIHPNLLSISNKYDGILLDAYGVFWGGNAVGLLPGAKEVMETLVKNGKVVGILSNTTQLGEKEKDKLLKHGLIEGQHYLFFISSGMVGKDIFHKQKLPFPTPRKTFCLFGTPHPKFNSHQAIFHNTVFTEIENIHEADFVYISIPHIQGEDTTDPKNFEEEIQKLLKTGLPLVCPNPDRYAHEGNPPQAVVRQGTIAEMYQKLGGQVFYIGKPYPVAYDFAMGYFHNFHITDHSKILMVGDTPETDIRGANQFGMSSALITETGIMADRIAKKGFDQALHDLPSSDHPTYYIKSL